jgi:hypothetical protein
MARETRGGKYGRNLALLVNYTIRTVTQSEKDRQAYRERFVAELKRFSFETRKKGAPVNSGCVRELDGMEEIDMRDPEQLAKLIKEGIHLMYQKGTAKKVMTSLLENL